MSQSTVTTYKQIIKLKQALTCYMLYQVTPRLNAHPAMITVLEMGAVRHFLRTQQLARSVEERTQILQPTLEINAG